MTCIVGRLPQVLRCSCKPRAPIVNEIRQRLALAAVGGRGQGGAESGVLQHNLKGTRVMWDRAHG